MQGDGGGCRLYAICFAWLVGDNLLCLPFSSRNEGHMMTMSRFFSAGIVLMFICLGTLAGVVRAEESLWQTDFEAAKAKAKAEKKLLLVDCTGSDWCGWCKKLIADVFDKEKFKTEAPKRFVLVELDYPNKKKQPAELKKQNEELQKRYKITRFPMVLVMDADGQVIACTGYKACGPESYLKQLGDFIDVYGTVVAMPRSFRPPRGWTAQSCWTNWSTPTKRNSTILSTNWMLGERKLSRSTSTTRPD